MEELQLGRLTLQPRRQLLANGERVPLGRRGLEILSVLAEAKGEIVTKNELMDAVWPQTVVEENAMQAQITALRKALGSDAELLQTIRGIGYRLEPPVASATAPAAPAPHEGSIIVLPFDNMSGDPEQDYFADGITEDIITDLSKVSALRVIARNTSFAFRGHGMDVHEIVRRFGVSHVLEGSVRKVGGRVRITAQLIDGSNEGHVWAERYDRDLNDIFALQDEVTRSIVAALQVRLQPGESQAIQNRGTDNLQAYDLYLRARSLHGQFGVDFVERSVKLAREAMAADPEFILAYRQLAASLDQLEFLMPERRDEIIRERQALIERVSTFAPDDPLFLLIRCRLLVCEGELVRAEQLNGSVPPGRYMGTCWAHREFFDFYVGRFRNVLDSSRRQVGLDPMDPMSSLGLHDLLDINGLLDEADAENLRNRDLPGDRVYFELAYFLRGKGRASPEELSRRYRRMLESSQFVHSLPLLAQLEPVLHAPMQARQFISQAVSDPGYQDSHRQLWIAMLAAYYDDVDLALEILRRIFVEREHVVDLRCAMWTSTFRQVRRDPRFKDILRGLGLYDYWRKTGRWGDFVRPVGDDDFEVFV